MKRQTFMCYVHLVNKLLEWHCETQAHLGSAFTSVWPEKKAPLSVLTICFSCCWNFTTPTWLRQMGETSRHTGINMSNSTLPMVRKQFKELRNFCVSAAGQASQLHKIYRTIKTGGWIQPWDKFFLLPSGWVHIFVKLVSASLSYNAVSGCLGIVLLPCQSYKMFQ